MPIDPATLGLISAGGNLLGQGMNMANQQSLNNAQLMYSQRMYKQQRNDALSDWHRMNEYNSPAAQMSRLKAAGINPHMVFANGATHTAAPVRSSDMMRPQIESPKVDFGSAIGQFQDVQVRQAQTNVLKEQARNIAQDTLNKALEYSDIMPEKARNIAADTNNKNTQAHYEWKTMEARVEQAQAALDKLYADTEYSLDRNVREQQLAQGTLKEQLMRMKSIEWDINNKEVQNGLLKLERAMLSVGVTKGDSLWVRVLANLGNSSKSILQKIKGLTELFDAMR